jgi:hypothetical protein
MPAAPPSRLQSRESAERAGLQTFDSSFNEQWQLRKKR